MGANVQRKRCLTNILEQVSDNNLRKKLSVVGASVGPEIAGGQYLRKTSRSPKVNKMLIEVN